MAQIKPNSILSEQVGDHRAGGWLPTMLARRLTKTTLEPTPNPSRSESVEYRVGRWLPLNKEIIGCWLENRINEINQRDPSFKDFHPVIQEFQTMIEQDAEIYMGFHEMFEQVPFKYDPTSKPQVKDYQTMLALFDHLLTKAPEFEQNELIGCPYNAILDWPMGTPAGYTMFTNPKVNALIKKVLDVWGSFLRSPESRKVLNTGDNGWLGPRAMAEMPNFADTYVCDPAAKYYGFTSWDKFFTRTIRPGRRPVAFPDDNHIINNPCESTIYCVANKVKTRDSFWVKGQPYSLSHMLNNDPLTSHFSNDAVGATVLQAYLSALDYHRWHSPVNGKIVKTVMVPGTYFAECPAVGFDPAGPISSQSFITNMAARALVFIEADSTDIGLMCFIAVGMTDVSTCQISVWPGDIVKKGDELGMFHFGGSSHCLVFRPETDFNLDSDYAVGTHVKVNAALGTATRRWNW